MTDEEVYKIILDYMQKSDADKQYDLSSISKEHAIAYDIQNFFIQTSPEMIDIYSNPYYKYSICGNNIEKRLYSKNKGVSGFSCNYRYKRYQVIFLKNVKTSKSICIHDATSNWGSYLSFKTYLKILEAVRYILNE